MFFKSLALSFCVALAGVAVGTIVFFLVHTRDTGEPVQATLQITKEWTTETRSDLKSIGAWLTRVETSPVVTFGGELDASASQQFLAVQKDDRVRFKKWPRKMTLGAPKN